MGNSSLIDFWGLCSSDWDFSDGNSLPLSLPFQLDRGTFAWEWIKAYMWLDFTFHMDKYIFFLSDSKLRFQSLPTIRLQPTGGSQHTVWETQLWKDIILDVLISGMSYLILEQPWRVSMHAFAILTKSHSQSEIMMEKGRLPNRVLHPAHIKMIKQHWNLKQWRRKSHCSDISYSPPLFSFICIL